MDVTGAFRLTTNAIQVEGTEENIPFEIVIYHTRKGAIINGFEFLPGERFISVTDLPEGIINAAQKIIDS